MPTENILVVEDEENIQELIRYNLAKEGYQVTCVPSGEKGLEAARKGYPDLVLLDLMLPGLDGLDVCKEMKRDATTRTARTLHYFPDFNGSCGFKDISHTFLYSSSHFR